MCDTSLNIDTRKLGCEYITRLLDIAGSVKEDAIDASSLRVELHHPWLKQGCNKGGILLATLNEMIGTCENTQSRKETSFVSHTARII